ncbi:MAG: CHASE2 domain-containing protein, partial [Alphaproteobacteria bacterium]|nr:CHASE2 domain-containing protein [Alphaproteobacteria bacterium]
MSSSSGARPGFAVRRRLVELRRRRWRRWRGRIAFALALALLIGTVSATPLAAPLHRVSLDLLFVARHWAFGPIFAPEKSDVVVVAIDEETHHTHPFVTRPRIAWAPELARVIEAIDAAGPRVIGYDFVDPNSLDQPDLLPRFDRPLLRAFAQAGRAGRLVIGEITLSGATISPYRGQRVAVGGNDNIRLLNFLVDDDEVIRRHAAGFRGEGDRRVVPSFAVELATRAGASPPSGDFLINFNTGADDVPTYSLADLLACAEGQRAAFFERAFKDKIVLIGPVLDIEDRHYPAKWLMPTRPDPRRQARCMLAADTERFGAVHDRRKIPGVLIHAAAINTMTSGMSLQELPIPAAAT